MIPAVTMTSDPDRRRMNLGNSKSSELMVVKVRGIKIASA